MVGLGVAVVDGPNVGVKVAALGLGLNSTAFAAALILIDAGDMDLGAMGMFPAAGPVGIFWGCSGIGTGERT